MTRHQIHYLQHVPFEGLGAMQTYFDRHQMPTTSTKLYDSNGLKKFPSLNEFDVLVIMGGPMSVHDESLHSWLKQEKQFIQSCLHANKPILGICLGAQLLAQALEAQVSKNLYREIGWWPSQTSRNIKKTAFAKVWPKKFLAFHWHGETFSIPKDAEHLVESPACLHQGFSRFNRQIGLQFHLETTLESAQLLVEHCSDELDNSTYVQSIEKILQSSHHFDELNLFLFKLLDEWLKNI